MQHKLEDLLPRLGTLTFQLKLGSMLDKIAAHRNAGGRPDAHAFGLSGAEAEAARRAAQLCKADLVTHMVVEMTSLQGIMGRYYALHSGESEAVAEAILSITCRALAGDALPRIAGRAGGRSGRPAGLRWPGCLRPGWLPPARKIRLRSAAPPWVWCRR